MSGLFTNLSNVVRTTGNQVINGIKRFTSRLIIGGTITDDGTSSLQVEGTTTSTNLILGTGSKSLFTSSSSSSLNNLYINSANNLGGVVLHLNHTPSGNNDSEIRLYKSPIANNDFFKIAACRNGLSGLNNSYLFESFSNTSGATRDIRFKIRNFADSIDVTALSIAPTGNILINSTTDNITDKLQVNGTISGQKLNIKTLDNARNLSLGITDEIVFSSNPTGSTRCLNVDPFIYLQNLVSTVPFYGANLKMEFGTKNTYPNAASSNNSVVTAANIYSLIVNSGGGTLNIANNIGANIMADVGGNLPGVTITNNIGLRVESVASKGTTTITNAYGTYITRPNHGVNRYGLFLEAPTGGTINWSLLSQGRVAITDTTSNGGTITNGALVVSGDIGLGGNINLGGNIVASGSINSVNNITTNAALRGLALHGVSVSGTNVSGFNLTIRPGIGTGNAVSPDIVFQTPNPTSTGSNQQLLTDKMTLKGNGRLLLGSNIDDSINIAQFNGSIIASQFRLSANNTAPSSPADTGILGETRWTQNFIYYCYANNNWSRFPKDSSWV